METGNVCLIFALLLGILAETREANGKSHLAFSLLSIAFGVTSLVLIVGGWLK